MTTTPPDEPGWWLASDARWYPPEQHPSNTGFISTSALLEGTSVHRDAQASSAPAPTTTAAAAAAEWVAHPTLGEPAKYGSSRRLSGSTRRRWRAWPGIVIVMVTSVVGGGLIYATLVSDHTTTVHPLKPLALPPSSQETTPQSTSPATPAAGAQGTSAPPTAPPATAPAAAAPPTTAPPTTVPPVTAPPTTAPATGAPPAASGCQTAIDPSGSCITVGEACPSSEALTVITGPGGQYDCAATAYSVAGNPESPGVPVGFAWQSFSYRSD
jgi:hypothetical protein